MSSYTLTKRNILQAIECPTLACLSLRDRARSREKSEPDPATLIQLAYGHLVGAEARNEFPGGFAVDGAGFDESLRLTEECIGRGETVLFEAAFAHGPVRARPDILVRNGDETWNLWEVKAGAEPKEEYLVDIAVQIHVLEGLGMSVKAGLMLVDREATRLSPTLFRRLDCDEEARLRLPLVREIIGGLGTHVEAGEIPDGVLGRRCRDCVRRSECWPRLPRRSVLDLYQGHGGWRTVEDLIERRILEVSRMPDDVTLTDIQRRQVQAVLSEAPVIVGDPVEFVARELVFPLHFLDFEAARPPVPEFPGQHPYDLIPFQWSCHVQEKEGAPLVHHEFLSNRPGDPRRPMTEALLRTIRPEGSILVYSSFEQEVFRNMAVEFPDRAPDLLDLENRLVDLLPVVRDHIYHPDFGGSFSIKNVLPVLAPGRGYGGLGISDGMEAVWAYHRLTAEDLGDDERERISRDLLDYCEQDSLAMYEVYQALASGGGSTGRRLLMSGGTKGRKIIDISRPLSAHTAPWPGDDPFHLEWRWRVREGKPVNLSVLHLSPHIGTHVDAPLHVVDGEPGIGEVDLIPFVGPARVVEVRVRPGASIDPGAIDGLDLTDPPRILLKTGTNDDPEKWNPEFAGLEEDTARALVRGGAKLVGLDTPGVDPPDSVDLTAHKILAAGGLRWIENLDLRGVEPGLYELIALPLRIVGGDGSPVRAILIQS